MGQTLEPQEIHGATCGACQTHLPAVSGWVDVDEANISGYRTFIFLKGKYYRREIDSHRCPKCFRDPNWQQREADERRKREQLAEKKREDERRKREQLAEKKREDERRKREQLAEKKREDERRKREQLAEKKRLDQQKKKALSDADTKSNFHHEQLNEESIRKVVRRAEEKQKQKRMINPPLSLASVKEGRGTFHACVQIKADWALPPENITEDDVLQVLLRMEANLDFFNDLSEVQVIEVINVLWGLLSKWKHERSEIPNCDVLKWFQFYFLVMHMNTAGMSIPLVIQEQIEDLLSSIQNSTSDLASHVELTQVMFVIGTGTDADYSLLQENEKPVDMFTVIASDILSNAIRMGLQLRQDDGQVSIERTWLGSAAQEYINLFVPEVVEKDSFCFQKTLYKIWEEEIWTFSDLDDVLPFMEECINADQNKMAQILELILAYRVKGPTVGAGYMRIIDYLEAHNFAELRNALSEHVKGEKERDVDEICREIIDSKDLDSNAMKLAQTIVQKVKKSLLNSQVLEAKVLKTKAKQSIKQLKEAVGVSEDMVDVLCTLCIFVHQEKNYWPRDSQLLSCVLLLMSCDSKGRMIEIATGEGKSCIITLLSAYIACCGKKVDVVTSSPVLAERDAEDWQAFYKKCCLNVRHNINISDKEKKTCYSADVVYGTVGTFASDILSHEFMRKDVRGNRECEAVIVDEVDFMLLDQGVQFTYLSSPTAGLHHLDVIYAVIWSLSSKYRKFVVKGETYLTGDPMQFHTCISQAIGLHEPLMIPEYAEERGILKEGFTAAMQSDSQSDMKAFFAKVTSDELINILKMVEEKFIKEGYAFKLYQIGESNDFDLLYDGSKDSDPPKGTVPLLFIENGYLTAIHSEDMKRQIVEEAKDVIDKKLSVPRFLRSFVMNMLGKWVDNALVASHLSEDREYLLKDSRVIPIDYGSTGMIELNKRWGDGLQQFVELKHSLPLSETSLVTNFMSNLSFFERYKNEIYGVTGTLGSKTDRRFMKSEYDVEFCTIPTHKVRKLYEEVGLVVEDHEKWLKQALDKVKHEIREKTWGSSGRAALIICEDIKTAEMLHSELQKNVTSDVILYTRSDHGKMKEALDCIHPAGTVIVATNLAGRGTDVKVTDEVVRAGGLYVLVTFLPSNTRIERQAFGRSGRKGLPGSAQIIVNLESLPQNLQDRTKGIGELKEERELVEEARVDEMMKTEVAECKFKEKLFANYKRQLKPEIDRIRAQFKKDEDEQEIAIQSMHDCWGFWLQEGSDKISSLDQNLKKELSDMISKSANEVVKSSSPSNNLYTIVHFGNELVFKGKYREASKLFREATTTDEKWSCIAYYNQAYSVIKSEGKSYMSESKELLEKAKENLKNNKEELITIRELAKNSVRIEKEDNGFDDRIADKVQVLNYFEQNIAEASQKLSEIDDKGEEAIAESTIIFSLIPDTDDTAHDELINIHRLGLNRVFTVKEKPRFCWEALLVFLLGFVQAAAGMLLTIVSVGSLSAIGTSLIEQGASDMIEGIRGMVSGTFDLVAWGISKAINIAVSCISFGIKKFADLMKKTFSVAKNPVKAAQKGLSKGIEKGREITDTVRSQWRTETFRNAMKESGKVLGKELAKEAVMAGLESLEDKIIDGFLEEMKKEFSTLIFETISQETSAGQLSECIDDLCYFHYVNGVLDDPTVEKIRNEFKWTTHQCLDDTKTPSWQNYVQQIYEGVLDKLKSEKQTWVKVINMTLKLKDYVDYISKMHELTSSFIPEYKKHVRDLCEKNEHHGKRDISKEKAAGFDTLHIKKHIASDISDVLADAAVEIFYQKIGRHAVKDLRKKVNRSIDGTLDKRLKLDSSRDKLEAFGAANSIASAKDNQRRKNDMNSQTTVNDYIRKRVESDEPASLVEAKALANAHNMSIEILTESSRGKMEPLSLIGSGKEKTIKLIYRKPIVEGEVGHYDVLIDGKVKDIQNKGNDCLYRAVAQGLDPSLPENKIDERVNAFRSDIAKEMSENSGRWANRVEQLEKIQSIRGGKEIMMMGAQKRKFDQISTLNPGAFGNSGKYIELRKETAGMGASRIVDHQPPLASLIRAYREMDPVNHPLAHAFGTGLTFDMTPEGLERSSRAGNNLIGCIIPDSYHRYYQTTGASNRTKRVHQLIAERMLGNDVVKTFKYTFLASSPEFLIDAAPVSKRRSLRKIFAQVVYKSDVGFKNLFEKWDAHFEAHDKGNPSKSINRRQRKEIKSWIENGGYKDRNDPVYKELMEEIIKF